jgi:predicted metal-dependent phosphoesterase TrpH/ABC-type lipoprotein export system ATPase subunit
VRDITTSSGAEFIRADLHIHSYGASGSYDVTDNEMTPEKIVDESIRNNLGLISITDHNEILNSQLAIQYANGKSITVIPGIEVSTIQGHLLAYFGSFEDLRNFYNKLSISNDRSRCDQGLKQCLDSIAEYNGIGILAHIELDSGFEKSIGRFNPIMDDIFCHSAIYGMEIAYKCNYSFYTDEDDKEERKKLVNLRRSRLSSQNHIILPKVMFSDAHTLEKFGKNASGDYKLTRIKVEEKRFAGLKIALINYESRIRIEELIPENIPHFIGMTIDGGLLDKQDIKFSKNLTCIIGGRGTGKSTLLESLRIASGNESENNVVDCEIWPDEINLQYIDETDYISEFRRLKESQVDNITDAGFGLEKIRIESYGQGETTATIQDSDNDPKYLLKFLDSFINIKTLLKEDEEICELLSSNRNELLKLRIELTSENEYSKNFRELENKKLRLEREKVGDLVKYHTSLVTERNLRKNVAEGLTSLVQKYRNALGDIKEFEYFHSFDANKIIVGKEEFLTVKKTIEDFSITIKEKNDEISKVLNEKIILLKDLMSAWKNKETEIYDRIETKKEELSKQGIPIDISRINQLAEDLELYRKKIIKCNQSKSQLELMEGERKELIDRRHKLRENIYKERYAFAMRINENLKNSVDGLFVKAIFEKGCFSFEFEEYLKKTMGWHTIQVSKAKIIASKMSPLLFSVYIKEKNKKEFKKTINDKRIMLSDNDVNQIFDIISSDKKYEEFESLKFEDKPFLVITKEVIEKDGEKKYITRPISQLSLGQQQSILLAILIQSESINPLLIDQPEDNLDSEFVYKTIVKNLRQIKERRQVIIVTHNANIAVLGDAELVIPLKSTSIRSYLQKPGSIDCNNIRENCCEILEGGRQAFLERKRIYNI